MGGAGRLFHTVVVVGASMGCGSGVSVTEVPVYGGVDAGEGAAFGGQPPHIGPEDCAQPSQFHCDDPALGQCTCDPAAPNDTCGCARPGEFRCRECLSGPAVLGRCPNDDGVDCFCNTSIEVAAPTDCAHPEQFSCAPTPFVAAPPGSAFASSDWFSYAECACDPAKPLAQDECTGRDRFGCSGSWTACGAPGGGDAAAAVPFDCACLPFVPPIL